MISDGENSEPDSDNSDSIPWEGYCLDDGTGQNIHYVNIDLSQTRKKPRGFKYELFNNGDRRYYNRGTCIRCKRLYQSTLITYDTGRKAVEYNICGECILATTPDITRLRGNGDVIYLSNKDIPKTLLLNLDELSQSASRESDILRRALHAKYLIQQHSNSRRNHDRRHIIAEKAAKYDIYSGEHVSWGGDDNKFDEYLGAVNNDNQPHGLGVKFYSDSSVYCGGWRDGVQHNSDSSSGYWLSSLETEYTGTWMFGLKHGRGTQSYPDGSLYIGEFAKGYEHGFGRKRLPDGNYFEGKYRFGRRDGHGTYMTAKGAILERGTFRDAASFEDVYPPKVFDVPSLGKKKGSGQESARIEKRETTMGDVRYFEPPSLMRISYLEIGRLMQPVTQQSGEKTVRLTSERVLRTLPSHYKQRLMKSYLKCASIQDKGSNAFCDYVMRSDIAFNSPHDVKCSGVCVYPPDIRILCFLQAANNGLKSLSLSYNKLSSDSIDTLFGIMVQGLWPNITHLDLSSNIHDDSSLSIIVNGLKGVRAIRSLRLSCCGIRATSAPIIAEFLSSDSSLQTLDLSFNSMQAEGAAILAEGLKKNSNLSSLSLRKNDIGYLGGESFLSLLQCNTSLLNLCLADNDIGVELSAQITGRSRSTVSALVKSTCAAEVRIPQRYLALLERAKRSHY